MGARRRAEDSRTIRGSSRLVAVLLLSAAAIGAAAFCVPLTPLRSAPVFTQIAAIDPMGLCVAAVIAVGCAIWLVACLRRGGDRRPALVALTAFTVLATLFAVRIQAQGVADGVSPPDDSGLRIVAWNAGDAGQDDLVDRLDSLLDTTSAQIVVLPETGWKTAQIVGAELHGHDLRVFEWEGTATSVLMDDGLAADGEYAIDVSSTPPWAGLVVRPAHPSARFPVIVAAHFQQPSADTTRTWSDHVRWAAAMCDSSPFVIIVGDLNTTLNQLDGSHIGACRDVAAARGAGAAATWPTWLPAAAGISLDRFMVGREWNPQQQTFRVLRGIVSPGADHWPIEVSLLNSPRGG
jgi:hypothetical protein